MDQVVGTFDYAKGGSQEKYTQELTLRKDGTATYSEFSETKYQTFTRNGSGTWKIGEDDIVWIIIASLTTDTKVKKQPIPIPGIKDEVKVDQNVAIDIPAQKLRTAPRN